jgi:hypothetical protein
MTLALQARQPALNDMTPWPDGPAIAAALRPAVPRLIEEMIDAIRAEIPEYDRPLQGSFGENVRVGTSASIERFLASIAGEEAPEVSRGQLYVELGRNEARRGRPIDTLLSAYRIGARMMWRGLAAEGQAAGIEPAILYRLAEAVFAYIDELSHESATGYSEEQGLMDGARERERERMLEVLLRRPAADPVAMHAQATRAEWTVPERFAPVAIPSTRVSARALEHRLPDGSMAATFDGMTVALVPDIDGPGRELELERALDGEPAARGASVGWQDAAEAISRAVLAAELQAAGVLADGPVVAADHPHVDLIVHRDPDRARALADTALAPLDALSPSSRDRLTETLDGWLANACNTTETARALHLHPQTLRYRLRQLDEVLGAERLADADARLALQMALKVRRAWAAQPLS